MSLERFHTALPEWLTVEQAVCAMIDGDNRIKLPMCYETIGLPFFDRIEECNRIMARLVESSLEFESNAGQIAALKQQESMDHITRLVELYRNDLGLEIDNAGKNAESAFTADDVVTDDDSSKHIKRAPFVQWARDIHQVDIFGYQARRERTSSSTDQGQRSDFSIPENTPLSEQELKARGDRNFLSGDRLWEIMTGERPGSDYSEGQKLFLSMAWLLDSILTGYNGEWRNIINNITDTTTGGMMIKGRPHLNSIVDEISQELPMDKGGKKPEKTIEGHIKLVMGYLTLTGEHVVNLSPRQQTMVFRTLYGLARAVWKVKTGTPAPDRMVVKYPDQIYSILAEGLTEKTPITPDDLNRCLDKAIQVVRKL